MKKRILNCVVLAVLTSMLALISACMVDEGSGAVGMTVSALTETCSGSAGSEPLKSIDTIRYEVTGPDRETGAMTMMAAADVAVKDGMAVLNISSVETGLDNVVTLIGFEAGKATWYGRHRDVSVVQGRTSEIDILLTRFGGFTCISPPAEFTPRVFPSVVALGDGRMLVTGGLVTRDSLDATTSELADPSNQAFIFDQVTGQYDYIGTMNVARAAHASVYIPQAGGDKVFIFGGTSKVQMKTGGAFPLTIDSADSLDSYEIFDVKTQTFENPGNDSDGVAKKMRLPRAFLSAVRLFDNTILITGGGSWPSDDPDYRFAEIWAPYADNNKGGMLDVGDRMPMNSQHNGAAVVKLEDTSQGLSRYLIVGGSPVGGDPAPESNVEIFTQSSKLEDGAGAAFKQRAVEGLPLLYFPTVTRIQNGADGSRRFLVVGGVSLKTGALTASPLKGYILNITLEDVVTVKALNSACAARFMHGAVATFDQDAVVVLGGFKDNSGNSNTKTCIYDDLAGTFKELSSGEEQFLSRAGFGAGILPDDTLFIAGGIVSAGTLESDATGMAEIYTPSVLWTAEVANGGM
jgi:hypothetical protein